MTSPLPALDTGGEQAAALVWVLNARSAVRSLSFDLVMTIHRHHRISHTLLIPSPVRRHRRLRSSRWRQHHPSWLGLPIGGTGP